MRFFNVYNKKGERIGEISEYEGGGGCALFSLVVVILVLGGIMWYSLFDSMKRKSSLEDIIWITLMFIAVLISIGYGVTRGRYRSFAELMILGVVFDTLFIGVGQWLFIKITEDIGIGQLFLSLFLSMLTSIFLTIISSTIVLVIRKIFKSSK